MDESFCIDCGLLSSKVELYRESKDGMDVWKCERHITKELNLHLVGSDTNG